MWLPDLFGILAYVDMGAGGDQVDLEGTVKKVWLRMDFETVSADAFGKSLSGIGLNLLVQDVLAQVAFLKDVFEVEAHQVTSDFAIITYHGEVMQIHADGTYHSNPLLSLLPEAGVRGAGLEIHFYNTDPDDAVKRAKACGAHVLAEPQDKPHGLRETYILCENGYAWVASRPLVSE